MGSSRVIHYKRKGFPRSTILTSLADAEKYPAKELVALYHERWELELAFDEVKTHLLEREETMRSSSRRVDRKCGGCLDYNLVRRVMERVAAIAGVPPFRVSFAPRSSIRTERASCGACPRLGTLPSASRPSMRSALILPERRTQRLPARGEDQDEQLSA